MSFIWHAFDYSFKLTCILVTIFMVVWFGIRPYLKNEDATAISFKSFYTEADLVYPSASVCFTSPYEGQELKMTNNITSISDYTDFLSGKGDPWNKDLFDVDFKNVSLKPLDYILGYKMKYRNMTEITKLYNESKTFVIPTIRLIMPNMICYGIDLKMTKETIMSGIIIKTNIFSNMIRPSHVDPSSMNRGLNVILHYPNQLLNTKWWKSDWPTRSDQASKSFSIVYDIRGVEVIRLRNKRGEICNDDINYDYDSEVFKEILDNAECKPPYTSLRDDLKTCDDQSKLKKINQNHFKLFSGLHLGFKPCKLLVKVNYEVTEIDTEETDPASFTINFNYKDDQIKVIQMVRAYDLGALVGNVGGYIGLFLGYTLMMIPEILKRIGKFCADNSNIRTQVMQNNDSVVEKQIDIDRLRFQIRSLEKRIDEIQS